ncbi:MAG: hypothetical protein U5L74_00515 [Ideonella sp.]|nr:hypothetical protein [Ideonella sp.]
MLGLLAGLVAVLGAGFTAAFAAGLAAAVVVALGAGFAAGLASAVALGGAFFTGFGAAGLVALGLAGDGLPPVAAAVALAAGAVAVSDEGAVASKRFDIGVASLKIV